MNKAIVERERSRVGRPPKPGGPDVHVSIRLPRTVLQRIDALANAEGLNRTLVIRDAIELYLAET